MLEANKGLVKRLTADMNMARSFGLKEGVLAVHQERLNSVEAAEEPMQMCEDGSQVEPVRVAEERRAAAELAKRQAEEAAALARRQAEEETAARARRAEEEETAERDSVNA